MTINKNKLTYDFATDGTTMDVQIGFTGTDNGEYINANIVVKQADLDTGKTFDDVTAKDLETIARKKLAGYTAVPSTTTAASN